MSGQNNKQAEQVQAALMTQQPIVELLITSLTLYKTHWRAFSKALFLPLLTLFGGIILAVTPPYLFADWLLKMLAAQSDSAMTTLPPAMVMGLMLLCSIPGFYFFTRGFWEYTVYLASLSQSAATATAGFSPDFKADYLRVAGRSKSYIAVLFLVMSVWLPSLCLYVLTPALALQFREPIVTGIIILGGGMVSGILALAATVLSVYLSLSFQVFVFEPEHSTPMDFIKRSFSLVRGNFWRCVFLLICLALITSWIAPAIVVLFFDLSQLTALLGKPVTLVIGQTLDPLLETVRMSLLSTLPERYVNEIVPTVTDISHMMVQTLVSMVVTAWLLPLGTFAFTRFYGDTASRKQTR